MASNMCINRYTASFFEFRIQMKTDVTTFILYLCISIFDTEWSARILWNDNALSHITHHLNIKNTDDIS